MSSEGADVSNIERIHDILRRITQVVEESAGDIYIFRGESRSYDRVSSGLYRSLSSRGDDYLDIEIAQEELLREARNYTSETDEFEILAELQHYGGMTNLIDFTHDCLIALFFACEANHTEDGRIVLLDTSGDMSEHITSPRNPSNRVIAQKSVFVRPPEGYVEPDFTIAIPKDLKQLLLDYLSLFHGVSTRSMYNDLHGFIRTLKIRQSADEELVKGIVCQESMDREGSITHYSKAIELDPQMAVAYNNRGTVHSDNSDFGLALPDFNRAIELDPEDAITYRNRGLVHSDIGEVGLALSDFNKAIELDPEDPIAYNYRGNSHIDNGDFQAALSDFNKAIELDPEDDIAYFNRGLLRLMLGENDGAKSDLENATGKGADVSVEFRMDYDSVADFEQRHNADVPADVAEMLGG